MEGREKNFFLRFSYNSIFICVYDTEKKEGKLSFKLFPIHSNINFPFIDFSSNLIYNLMFRHGKAVWVVRGENNCESKGGK